MKYKVKIRKLIDNGKPLKATCSVTLDDQFAVHGVKVIKCDKGTFIVMPSETYTAADGSEKTNSVFHPITSEARKELEDAVIAAYEAAVAACAFEEAENAA